MTADNVETLGRSVPAADALAILTEAVGDEKIGVGCRVAAAVDSRSPQEGLALLSAYVRIEDRAVRQAILDVVVALAGRATR